MNPLVTDGEKIITAKKLKRCPVFRVDLKGRFVNVDDLTEKLLGQPIEQFFGRNIMEFLDDESKLAVREVLSTGRHFETFYKAVNLVFVDSRGQKYPAGAIISLNFIGGNPANYQVILTSVLPENDVLDEPAVEEKPLVLENIFHYLNESQKEIDWPGLAECFLGWPEIAAVYFYLFDDGSLSLLGQSSRENKETCSIEAPDFLVDVGAKKQPYLPRDNEIIPFDLAFPLNDGERTWGVMRLTMAENNAEQLRLLSDIAGALGSSLYGYVRERWDKKNERDRQIRAFRNFLKNLNCTYLGFDRSGKVVQAWCLFLAPEAPLNTTDSVWQLFQPQSGIRLLESSSETLTFTGADGQVLSIPRIGYGEFRGMLNPLMVLDVPADIRNGLTFILLVGPGIRSQTLQADDAAILRSFMMTSRIFLEAIDKNAVRLAAKSYRQLGRDGQIYLNALQGDCRSMGNSMKRIQELFQAYTSPNEILPVNLDELLTELSGGNGNAGTPLLKRSSVLPVISTRKKMLAEVFRSILANAMPENYSAEEPPLRVRAEESPDELRIIFEKSNLTMSGPTESFFRAYTCVPVSDKGQQEIYSMELELVRRIMVLLGGKLAVSGDLRFSGNITLVLPKSA